MKDYFPGNLGGNDKRFNRSHRSYDSPLTRDMGGNQRRNGYHRKKGGQPHSNEVLNEMLTTVKDQLQKISDNQKRMADLQERSAVAEERKADALEQLVRHFSLKSAPFSEDTVESVTETDTPEIAAPAAEAGESLLDTITNMRDKGITFGKIADHLNEEGIPTTTGADLWNRLTVSKFYKEAVAQ